MVAEEREEPNVGWCGDEEGFESFTPSHSLCGNGVLLVGETTANSRSWSQRRVVLPRHDGFYVTRNSPRGN